MKPASNNLYTEIKSIVDEARHSVYRAVNFTMVTAYWEIGKRIVHYEQKGKKRAGYGEAVLKELSQRLANDFGKGFSVQSLENFRKFYLVFSPLEKSSAVQRNSATNTKSSAVRRISEQEFQFRPQLSWTHYKLLMRVENTEARNYYTQETVAQNWSTRALERQINSFYYERIVSSKKKKAISAEAKATTDALAAIPEDFIKDPYVLEFLHLPSDTGFLEKDMENAIIQKLQHFLLELGKGFSFVARNH